MIRRYYIPSAGYQFAKEVLENVNRCAAQASRFYVNSKAYWRQCSRPRGHGPGSAFCKQRARGSNG